MNVPNLLVWRIIGKDAPDDKESFNEETRRYQDLHYDRFTYYPFHERPRYERDYVRRIV